MNIIRFGIAALLIAFVFVGLLTFVNGGNQLSSETANIRTQNPGKGETPQAAAPSLAKEAPATSPVSISAKKQIPFETIEKSATLSSLVPYKNRRYFVINDQEAWSAVWNNAKSGSTCGVLIPPEIDFTKETVLAVFMGQKGPDYSIEIKNVIESENKTYVQVEEIGENYSPGKVSLPVVAIPYHFVKTQKLTKPLEFSFIQFL